MQLYSLFPRLFVPTVFPDAITGLSSSFVEIFNQASEAESLKLFEVAGPGYRKALEFLVKDFAISANPAHTETIKGKRLQKVINDYIDDANIKDCAERAWWLGNDESHYINKWEKDIAILKDVITLVVNWIDSHERTKKLREEMPQGK